MKPKFSLAICSDLDYEDMVIDISWENEMIAILDQEKGPNHKEIELLPLAILKNFKFSFNEFRKYLDKAEQLLDKSKKLPEQQ